MCQVTLSNVRVRLARVRELGLKILRSELVRTMDEAKWDQMMFFSPDEFVAPEKMRYELIRKLDEARFTAGIPFVITSSWRSDSKEHSLGEAVDIRCSDGFARLQIVRALLVRGFPRIGVYDRHIHAGISRSLPDSLWTGVSK